MPTCEFLPSHAFRTSFYKFSLLVSAEVVEAKNEGGIILLAYSTNDSPHDLVDLNGLDGFIPERRSEPRRSVGILRGQRDRAHAGFAYNQNPIPVHVDRFNVLIQQGVHPA